MSRVPERSAAACPAPRSSLRQARTAAVRRSILRFRTVMVSRGKGSSNQSDRRGLSPKILTYATALDKACPHRSSRTRQRSSRRIPAGLRVRCNARAGVSPPSLPRGHRIVPEPRKGRRWVARGASLGDAKAHHPQSPARGDRNVPFPDAPLVEWGFMAPDELGGLLLKRRLQAMKGAMFRAEGQTAMHADEGPAHLTSVALSGLGVEALLAPEACASGYLPSPLTGRVMGWLADAKAGHISVAAGAHHSFHHFLAGSSTSSV